MPEHQHRKRFGQHFLHDQNIIEKILTHLAPQSDDTLVEIGPGQGALTLPLLEQGFAITAIEMDRDLVEWWRSKQGLMDQLVLHQADALKFDFCQLQINKNNKLRVLGNLPYNISTPLLFHLLDQRHCIKDMLFMLQKEVVDRMVAKAGSKIYGRLSVMVQASCDVEALFDVAPGCFSPPPKVDSSIIRLRPYTTEDPYQIRDKALFAKVVKMAFQQRRKTLRNNLKPLMSAAQIESSGIDPQTRAETLSIQDFSRLANYLALLPG